LLLRVLAALSVLAMFVSERALSSTDQRSHVDTHPGFEGVWNSATATPLERPRQFGDKPFFTPQEAAEWERQVAQNNEERPPQPGARNTRTGTCNTFFNDGGGFYGDAGGNFGWDRNLRIVERFSLYDADSLLHQFEIDNPTAFTRPWKGELTMSRSSERLFEYACHEGNYSLTNMLRGYRAAERTPPAR